MDWLLRSLGLQSPKLPRLYLSELREEGHGDLKAKLWWPEMKTMKEMIDSCTIIIWTTSAYHTTINFAQYIYGGYPLNWPAIIQRFMLELGSDEYKKQKTSLFW